MKLKNMLRIVLMFVGVSLLSACGGGGTAETSVPMTLDQVYLVSSGQSIEKTSTDAQVEVTVNLETGTTQVVLLSGSANLITP